MRIVSCGETDVCACCGTHVSHTGEVGIVKVLSCQHFREGVRIELVSGERAYRYLNTVQEQNREISGLLSAPAANTAAAVKRMAEELEKAKYRASGYEAELFESLARDYEGKERAIVFRDGLGPDSVRGLAVKLMERCNGLCAVFSGDDGAGYKYALGQNGGDLRELVKSMNAALNGRGGGKPFFAQGSVSAAKKEILSFFDL